MKIIKFTDSVHERIMKDKEHFTETTGYRFTLSDTVREYQKILDTMKDKDLIVKFVGKQTWGKSEFAAKVQKYFEKKPPLQNSPRLPLEKPEDKQTCDFN